MYFINPYSRTFIFVTFTTISEPSMFCFFTKIDCKCGFSSTASFAFSIFSKICFIHISIMLFTHINPSKIKMVICQLAMPIRVFLHVLHPWYPMVITLDKALLSLRSIFSWLLFLLGYYSMDIVTGHSYLPCMMSFPSICHHTSYR